MSIQEKAEQYALTKHSQSQCFDSEREQCIDDYTAGYNEAIAQPKHIFDGAAVVGEVRRFEGGLVDVVDVASSNMCEKCVLWEFSFEHDCEYLTDCDNTNVAFIKRV